MSQTDTCDVCGQILAVHLIELRGGIAHTVVRDGSGAIVSYCSIADGERQFLRGELSTLQTHVIPRQSVEAGAIVLLWVIAILLWLASTFGNFVQFVGGWAHVWPLNEHTAAGVLYSLVYQAIFTVAQWGFKAKRWWALYSLALLASAIPSFLTYNSWWINPWIVARLGPSVPSALAWLIASAIIFVATVVNDLIPEWVLVE